MKFVAFDAEWEVRPPPASQFYRLVPRSPKVSIGFLADFLLCHVVPQQRDAMRATMREVPSLTADDLQDLMDPMIRAAYDGVGYRAVSSLLALWPERRHVHHGRLLSAGRAKGAADLNCYDVFCIVWAELDEAARASSEFTAVNFEGSDKLREQIIGMQGRSKDPESDLAEFRALLGRKKRAEAESAAEGESAT